jgi:archaellum component FlaC
MEPGRPQADFVEEFDGIRLSKSLEEDEYHLPSVELRFESERDVPATVSLRDPVPEGVSIEDIGFHRDYGKDCWEVEDGYLVFEYDFDPNEEFKTVYAFRAENVDVSPDLVTSPESVDVTVEESAVPDAKPMARSGAESPYSGDSANYSGSTDGGQEPAGGVDLDDESTETTVDVESGMESVADQLATELEQGEVSEENLEILEEHLALSHSKSGSEDARLEQLEADVANLRAYTNALEEFLDEEGSAQQIIEDFEQKVAAIENDLDSVQTTTSTLEGKFGSLESELQDVDDSVDSLSSELAELRTDLDSTEQDVSSLDERVPAYSVDERFDEVEDELDSIEEFVDNLKRAFE